MEKKKRKFFLDASPLWRKCQLSLSSSSSSYFLLSSLYNIFRWIWDVLEFFLEKIEVFWDTNFFYLDEIIGVGQAYLDCGCSYGWIVVCIWWTQHHKCSNYNYQNIWPHLELLYEEIKNYGFFSDTLTVLS